MDGLIDQSTAAAGDRRFCLWLLFYLSWRKAGEGAEKEAPGAPWARCSIIHPILLAVILVMFPHRFALAVGLAVMLALLIDSRAFTRCWPAGIHPAGDRLEYGHSRSRYHGFKVSFKKPVRWIFGRLFRGERAHRCFFWPLFSLFLPGWLAVRPLLRSYSFSSLFSSAFGGLEGK